jgi:hypothetical protein
MKAGNSKAKGSGFEREISKFFTEWLTGQSKEYYFWRSPSSGAISTITQGNGEISGDIIALKPEGTILTGKWSIEIKTGYPSSSFHKCLKGVKNDEIEAFWKQSVGDASRSKKQPMLIYKKKGLNILVGIPSTNDYHELTGHLKSITVNYGNNLPPIQFFDMKEFFVSVKPENI